MNQYTAIDDGSTLSYNKSKSLETPEKKKYKFGDHTKNLISKIKDKKEKE